MKAGGCFASGSLFQQFQNLLNGLAAGRDGGLDLFLILFGLLLGGDLRLFLSRLLQHPEFFFLRLQRCIQLFDLLLDSGDPLINGNGDDDFILRSFWTRHMMNLL